ncbi:ABC transporter permease [Brevibacterium sp.]|uniref:ABC transporter permease n=1 Tax=Brevibacterium sp. TaxID=1701 RepID=UPI0025C0A643|nr:ABC transporter permease [Brevibacterium sp.]
MDTTRHSPLDEQQLEERGRALARRQRERNLRRILDNPMLMIGAVVMVVLIVVAVVGPWLSPYTQFQLQIEDKLTGPSARHWLGTDDFGRDLATRLFHGLRTSLAIGLAVTVLSALAGTAIGLVSAYFRRVDGVLMRVMDGLMSFPSILLAICLMAAFGAKIENVIIALTIVFIPHMARVVRSAAVSVNEEMFIDAVQSQGASSLRIILRHVLPNIVSPIVVQATFIFADAIITEASLSFLGAGVPPPGASLGSILQDGKALIFASWWIVVFAGLITILCVFGLNFLGDGLRDHFDPRSGKRRTVAGLAKGQILRVVGVGGRSGSTPPDAGSQAETPAAQANAEAEIHTDVKGRAGHGE